MKIKTTIRGGLLPVSSGPVIRPSGRGCGGGGGFPILTQVRMA